MPSFEIDKLVLKIAEFRMQADKLIVRFCELSGGYWKCFLVHLSQCWSSIVLLEFGGLVAEKFEYISFHSCRQRKNRSGRLIPASLVGIGKFIIITLTGV